LSEPLLPPPPVAGGADVDLPGAGVRLRGTSWVGSGTPVVLLHGLASQRRFWNLVVPHLNGCTVLTLDQRGHGESERPESGYGFDEVTADVIAAVDALGWRRFVVVGHSWGAPTALLLAARHPDRVAAIVCIDGGFARMWKVVQHDRLRTMLTPPRIELPPDELRTMFRTMLPFWSPEVEQAVLPGFVVGADGLARPRLPFAQHMQIVDAIIDSEQEDVYERVACPTWLVSAEPVMSGGSGQQFIDAKADGLAVAAAQLAQPRLLRWAGAVHDVPLQWPALVAGLVRAAVDEAGEGVAG
jgi:pimeloyl-ACP methyl ester carboxylesterase